MKLTKENLTQAYLTIGVPAGCSKNTIHKVSQARLAGSSDSPAEKEEIASAVRFIFSLSDEKIKEILRSDKTGVKPNPINNKPLLPSLQEESIETPAVADISLIQVYKFSGTVNNEEKALEMTDNKETRGYRFNPPPGWPKPPEGWVPPKGWEPQPEWTPAPEGWEFFLDDREGNGYGESGKTVSKKKNKPKDNYSPVVPT